MEPKYRRLGITGTLFNAVFARLKEQNYRGRIRVCTLAANNIARETYKKYGFKPYEVIYETKLE